VAGNFQVKAVGFVHGGSENFGGGVSEVDLDEVGTETLVEIDGLTGFFRGFDADGTGPCWWVVIDLATSGEDTGSIAFAGADLVAPADHVIREVATHFADAHHTVGKKKIEHCLVFGGEAGSGLSGIRP
jgi:hypothetical protein